MSETRYQRLAREQAERQSARAERMESKNRKPRQARKTSERTAERALVPDPDGFDRDDLGESPDF